MISCKEHKDNRKDHRGFGLIPFAYSTFSL